MMTAVHKMVTTWGRSLQIVAVVLAALCATARPALAGATDPVLEWNDIARALIVVPAFSPVQQTRAMAIVQVAVHDAVSGITGSHQQHGVHAPAPAGASLEAAAIAAAYRALTGIVGASQSLASKYSTSLNAHSVSPEDPGLVFGQAIADAILASRHDDGSLTAAFLYLPEDLGDAGVWAPMSAAATAQALLPGWGNVRPWVLRSGSQFLPDPPPPLDSERYARDYNEVLEVGRSEGSTRTPEQTQIALFWRASPTALWNPVLRKAVESRSLDLPATARVFALFYLAAADASVACWNAKYFYNYWRPQPAIINGDVDGNDSTTGEATWRPLVPTPPHPEYASGHSSNSAAMAFVLSSVFGDAPGFVIEATSSQAEGVVRRWQTFSEGVDEVIDARVYSGIHFRTGDEVGARLGRQVAQFVLTHALRPSKGSGRKRR